MSEKKFESEQLDSLFAALAKAQGEMEAAKKDSSNPFYKSSYADLESVIEASRPSLCKNGLAVLQRTIVTSEGKIELYTRLGHSSGQWIESSAPLNPVKPDQQSLGSAITYMKRYTYCAMIGVVMTEDETDDDGERNMQGNISKEQLFALTKEINGDTELLTKILETYSLNKISDLPRGKFQEVMNRLRATKKEKDE